MKHLVTLSALLIAMSIVAACRHSNRTVSPYGWESLDPALDSLTVAAEQYMFSYTSIEGLDNLISCMDSVCGKFSGEKARKAEERVDFWHAYRLLKAGLRDSALNELKQISASSTDEYTMHRAEDLCRIFGGVKSVETFKYLLEQLDYYRRIDDKPQQGNTAMFISNSLFNTKVTGQSLFYLEMADSMFVMCGLDKRRLNLRINETSLLSNLGRMAESKAKFEKLLADSLLMAYPSNYEVMLRNYYYFFHDSTSLFKGYELIKQHLRDDQITVYFTSLRSLYEALLCEHYIEAGRSDSAAHYLSLSRKHENEISDYDIKSSIYRIYADYYKRTGDAGKAFEAMKLCSEAEDSAATDQQPQEKIYIDQLNTLHRHELNAAIANRDMKIRHYLIIGTLVMLIFIAILFFQRLQSKNKMKEVTAKLESERKERQLLAMSLSRDEADKMLNYVKDEAARLSRETNIPAADISRIGTNVRLHLAEQTGMAAFEEAFTEIQPDFTVKLRSIAPDLSDNNIRVCRYIYIGMTNQEIANAMNVSAGSLRVTRFRLRQKFGLTKDDSLEDFLRRLAE